ncbi:MAG: ABC transporter substrate-binding protein [Spirochaetales bacterium]|nr:ABC transporter substrate-binding protein [Spirochaetales bacterium]
MIKRLLMLFAVAMVVFGVFAASVSESSAPAKGQSVVVTDMVGRQVEIVPGSYTRVVCIGAGALRLYSYINGSDLLCGVEDIENKTLQNRPKMFDSVALPYHIAYGSDFEKLPSCGVGGPQAQTAEAEKILSCNPDIVISEYEDVDKSNALQEQLGVPVITLKPGQSVFADPFKDTLRLLGKVFCREERAEEIVSFVEAETQAIRTRVEAIAEADKPSVYICGLGNWGTTNHLMTSPNFPLFEAANVKNVLSGLATKGNQSIEKEKFVAIGSDIDIMIIDAAAVKNIRPLYAEDPTMFDSVKAWKEGEVYLQLAFNAYYTNYELALADTWFIAKSVYPQLFEDIDMNAKLDEITTLFLGQEMSEQIFAFPTSKGACGRIGSEFFK